MHFTFLLSTTLLLSSAFSLPAKKPEPSTFNPSGFIIKLKPQASQLKAKSFVSTYNQRMAASATTSDGPTNAIRHTYSPKFFNGFSGTFSQDFLEAFKQQHAADIEYIERDGVKHALGVQQNPPSWGLTRVSEQKLDLSLPYTYPDAAGAGVDVYIIDTGVQFNHTDFGGRAKMAKSFIPGEDDVDMNGHGTHVSGTIGSTTYGVAKQVNIFGVKVLDAQGSGSDSDVLAGINYVTGVVRPGKTVINMSLGGGKSQSIDDAVTAAAKAGVVVIVAAGNDGNDADACQGSPSGASGAFAVGATDNTDTLADFSDAGSCVKILAPGVNITSLWLGDDSATNTISGTSMATPHVVGVAALLMSQKSYTTAQAVYDDLTATAGQNAIQNVPSGTVNAIVYNGAGSSSNDEPAAAPSQAVAKPTQKLKVQHGIKQTVVA